MVELYVILSLHVMVEIMVEVERNELGGKGGEYTEVN